MKAKQKGVDEKEEKCDMPHMCSDSVMK